MTGVLQGPGAGRASRAAHSIRSLAATRVVRPYGPHTVFQIAKSLTRWGLGPAGGFASLAARVPERTAIVDDVGSLTFTELHTRANALARALAASGVTEGDAVALLCRNHRWFVIATVAVSRLGADVLYLNTAFSGPQVVELLDRERPVVVLYDAEFESVLAHAGFRRIVAWAGDAPLPAGAEVIDDLVGAQDGRELSPPSREGRSVILTSGTTGTPKGATRPPGTLTAAAALVSRIPLRFGRSTHIAAPMFHTWGWAHLNLAMLLGSTLVLRTRFDPEGFLAAVSENHCDTAVVIPVMLRRVLELPAPTRSRYDTRRLRVVAASGSALPGDLATEWMDAFGDNLYNTYGSTECAWVTIAQPAEMRARPGTAGRPPLGTSVALFDDDDEPVSGGQPGRIFVANPAQFEGYTNGDHKAMIDTMMSTGDIGRITDGLLFVEGRDDDMVVSGGENVYPQEVEDVLVRHVDVLEAACVPVDDPQWGQRLVAYVAVVPGSKVTEADLAGHVKQQLARYKVPRSIRFCEELPRNATGKVLKRELTAD